MIQFNNVTKRFKNGTIGLSHINLKITDGEFIYVVGPSGAGKSTLIKLLIKEYLPTSGEIIVDGINIKNLSKHKVSLYRRNIGFVFQNFRLLSDRTAFENIAFAAECIGLSYKHAREKSLEMLEFVGLSDRRKHMPHELSAGEQQRIAIARAIVNNPRMIIADEPTGNLDPNTAEDIIQLMERIHGTGATIIMATHSHNLVQRHPHRVLTIENGSIIGNHDKGVFCEVY